MLRGCVPFEEQYDDLIYLFLTIKFINLLNTTLVTLTKFQEEVLKMVEWKLYSISLIGLKYKPSQDIEEISSHGKKLKK